jgi:hypothetical protein
MEPPYNRNKTVINQRNGQDFNVKDGFFPLLPIGCAAEEQAPAETPLLN